MKDYAASLLKASGLARMVAFQRVLPPTPPVSVPLPADLPPELITSLRRSGIDSLYSHQAEAIAGVRAGRSTLVVTPTASGKSLIYNIPVLDACLRDPRARALYIFPYKALEQDQRAAFENLAAGTGALRPVRCAIYDGDTPPADRRRLRAEPPHVLITNPDMIHLGLLPHHGDWAGFLGNLRLVVVDEMHVYRGVFGTHLHHILQRLRRVCRHHGADPTIVSASATVGEPSRLARDLLARDVQVIERSGAPRSGRHVVFLDPRMEMSPYTVAQRLLVQAVQDGRRTIVFTKARRITELIHSWVARSHPKLRRRIASYRSGYLAEERREIERRLAAGDLLGVVSTSALEHGIDIGGLDVCVLVGYPGSIISSWQRIGRVGRKERDSLVLLVAMPDALDQYFLSRPEEFFDRPYERVVLDPANPVLASAHLVCAGAELPLTPDDASAYGEEIFALVPDLVRRGKLMEDVEGDRWYSLRRRPQRDVSLRSMAGTVEIRDRRTGRTMGTIDAVRARLECHAGAVYLHRGRSWLVRSLDLDRSVAHAEPAFDIDYFTVPLTEKETEVLERRELADHGAFRSGLGRLKVTTHFRGFVRKSLANQEIISEHELDLPPSMFESVGLWVEIPPSLAAEIARREGHFMGAIHATEHAAIGLFPLLALCDRWDLGGISYPSHPQLGVPAFFIYDGHAGGIGLAAQGHERIRELLDRTRELVTACPCEIGCPSCVQSPKCGNGNRPLDKSAAIYLLEVLCGLQPVPEPVEMPAAVDIPAARRPAPALPEPGPSPTTAGPRAPAILSGAAPAGDVFFDLETRRSAADVGGWSRIADMGLALAVVWNRGADRWRIYREDEAKDLIIDLLSARRVVGFNVRRFDYTVLSAYAAADFSRVPTLDLLEEIHRLIGFRISLGALAEATLGVSKGGDGLQSLAWVREGRWDLVETYCRKDVELTARLFDYGRLNGHLVYRDRQGRSVRIPAPWSEFQETGARC